MNNVKQCKKCNEIKDINLKFSKSSKQKISSYCKPCANYLNRIKRKGIRYQSSIDWRIKNSNKLHDYSIKKTFGQDGIDFYKKQIVLQNGQCAICLIKNKIRKDSDHLQIDHDHKTGVFRGLLCMGCNCAIGKFKEDISLLQNCFNYLIKNPIKIEKLPIYFYRPMTDKEHKLQWHLKNNFGIHRGHFWAIKILQNDKCAICQQPERFANRHLAIDHKKNSNPIEIRGLLCFCCNTGLGNFKDNPFIVLKAIKYLQNIN